MTTPLAPLNIRLPVPLKQYDEQNERELRRQIEVGFQQVTSRSNDGVTDGLYAAEGFFFNAGNVLVGSTESDWLDLPSDFTITSASIVADQTGSISVAVYVSTYANWNVWTLISASDPLVLSGTSKNGSNMVGWTKTFSGGRYLKFVITGTPTNITKVTVALVLAVPAGAAGTGSAPSGAAGGHLQGTYPNPTIIPNVPLAGSPTTTTQSANDNSTKIATTAYVDTGLALKANLASPTFTGDPKAPTPSPGDNDTSIATTAFVAAAIAAGGGAAPAEVLISSQTPSGTGTVTFNSISGSYRDLRVVVRGRGTNASLFVDVKLTLNNDTTANYDYQTFDDSTSSVTGAQNFGTAFIHMGYLTAGNATASVGSACEARIYEYAGTTFQKAAMSYGGLKEGTSSGQLFVAGRAGFWRSTSAVTRVDVTLSAGNFVAGSSVSLYGIS